MSLEEENQYSESSQQFQYPIMPNITPLPIIIFKKDIQTNYLDDESLKWYIDPSKIQSQIKKTLNRSCIDLKSGDFLASANGFRKCLLLTIHYNDPLIKMQADIGLGISYFRIAMTIQAQQIIKANIHRINKSLAKQKYTLLQPSNFFSSNQEFYEVLTKKFVFRRLRARLLLFEGIINSELKKHQQAYQNAFDALKDTYHCCCELYTILLGKNLRNVYLHRSKNQNKTRKRLLKQFEYKQTLQLQKFEDMSELLTKMKEFMERQKQLKKQSIPKILQNILCDLKTQSEKSTYFSNVSAEQHNKLPQKQKKKNENSIYNSIKILDFIQMQDILPNETIPESLEYSQQWFLEIVLLFTICCYSLSTQSRFIEKGQPREIRETKQILKSQHWLSKSLETSHRWLSKTIIFEQIYSVYHSLHSVQAQIIEETQDKQQQSSILKSQKKSIQVTVLKPFSDKTKMNPFDEKYLKSLAPLVIRKFRQLPKEEDSANSQINSIKMWNLSKKLKHHKKKEQQLKEIVGAYNQIRSTIKTLPIRHSTTNKQNRTNQKTLFNWNRKTISSTFYEKILPQATNNINSKEINIVNNWFQDDEQNVLMVKKSGKKQSHSLHGQKNKKRYASIDNSKINQNNPY